MAILEIKDLIVDYGIIRAIKGINMKVERGTIVAVLGANGAGKTTTIRTISGMVKAKSGEIVYKGKNIINQESHKISSKGIHQSPEGRLILNGLTVEENLRVGAYALKKETRKTELGQETIKVKQLIKETMEEVFEYFPILKERRKQQASTLSGGEQQMLAIGRALMGRPELLLLDEPSLGLAPLIVRDIFHIINEIKKRGQTILIVEQNAYQTLKIADYVYVLELGKVKAEGLAQDLLKDDSIVKAYLGN
jgi:branched-chain amino acid transport system ATP-binding protein